MGWVQVKVVLEPEAGPWWARWTGSGHLSCIRVPLLQDGAIRGLKQVDDQLCGNIDCRYHLEDGVGWAGRWFSTVPGYGPTSEFCATFTTPTAPNSAEGLASEVHAISRNGSSTSADLLRVGGFALSENCTHGAAACSGLSVVRSERGDEPAKHSSHASIKP